MFSGLISEIVRIEVYTYLEEIGIEDVDDYLFLLFSLTSGTRTSGVLVLPIYSPLSGEAALKKNFESVFKWIKVSLEIPIWGKAMKLITNKYPKMEE